MANILVVDDDPSVLRFTALLLKMEGWSVETVDRARDGLDSLHSSEPDLVILDLNMPEMDGRTFYREARARGYEGPIVICSAYSPEAARLELGAEAALPKPFEPETLVTLVQSLVET